MRPKFPHVLLPRFGGSYITLWAPLLRSIGLAERLADDLLVLSDARPRVTAELRS
jgi:hypothetical protein